MRERFAITVAAAALGIFALVVSTPSRAKDNPGGGPAACLEDPDADQGGDTTLYYCCYDDGCWICDWSRTGGLNCTWDPSYGARGGRLPRNIRRPDIYLPPVTPKPPRSQPPTLGPLETSPGSPQGPPAPGTPTRPPAGKLY